MNLLKKMYKYVFLSIVFFCTVDAVQNSCKILCVVHKFPKLTETFIISQLKACKDAGYDVTIWAQEKDTTPLIHDDIFAYNLLSSITYIDFYNQKKYAQMCAALSYFDIVYCQYDRIGCVFAKLKEKIHYKAKLVISVRGWPLTGNRIEKNRSSYEILFKQADLILPVCIFFKNEYIKFGCPSEKIRVHHSAIDCNTIRYIDRSYRNKKTIDIVTIARLIPSKGVDVGITAVSNLMKRYPYLRYTIIGDGIEYDHLKKYIKMLGMHDYIRLVGWQQHDMVIQTLYNADIYMHPSVGCEGIPNAIMEAMATGLPVVATDVNGTSELVHDGNNGFIVPAYSINALEEKIDLLINDALLRYRLGVCGREYVEQEHNINKENKNLITLFEQLVC